MATDTTGVAWDRYMRKHSCWALPHVFVVDRTGTILWHGQSNRRGLVPSLKTIVRQVDLTLILPLPLILTLTLTQTLTVTLTLTLTLVVRQVDERTIAGRKAE